MELPRSFYVFLLSAMLAALTGCVQTTYPVVWQEPGMEWVYPPPPQQARIRFLREIASLEDIRGKEDKNGEKILSWISGEEPQQGVMLSPYGVAADGEGLIWMTSPAVGMLYQIDLVRQRIDYFTILSGRQLRSPTGIVYDPDRDRLYLADAGLGYVMVLDSELNLLLSLKPTNDFGRAGGMAIGSDGKLYVADALNGVVEVFSSSGGYLESLGSQLTDDGKFNHPSNVAIDLQGRVYVVDSFNFGIEILGLEGEPPSSIGCLGDSVGCFSRPRGIAIDSVGHIYVSDAGFDNIQVFNRQGQLLLVLGQKGEGPDEFCLPAGLFFDSSNRLYVSDSCKHQVKIFEFISD